jgi:hypothetical protein
MRSIHCPVGTHYLPFGFHLYRSRDKELAEDTAPNFKEILRLDQHTGKAYIVRYAEELDLILLAGHFHSQGNPAASHKLNCEELTDRLDQLQRFHGSGQQGICTATLKALHIVLIIITDQYQHKLRRRRSAAHFLAKNFSGRIVQMNIDKNKIDRFALNELDSGGCATDIENLEIRSSQECAVTLGKGCRRAHDQNLFHDDNLSKKAQKSI